MITKGIIKAIDYNTNVCTVRIPLFEGAGNPDEITAEAIISTTPGVANCYKEQDVVLLSFEENSYNKPIVLGKLYLGANNEDARGAINCESLQVKGSVSLPLTTKLTFDGLKDTYAGVDGDYTSYKTLEDVVNALQKQSNDISEHGTALGQMVTLNRDAKVTGFGWVLDDSSWRIQSFDDSHVGLPLIDILTVNNRGLTVRGEIRIEDYPTRVVITYAQNDSETTPPDVDNESLWSETMPSWDHDKYIWQRITTYYYEYDEATGDLIEKKKHAVTCLSSAIDSVQVEKVETYYKLTDTDVKPSPTDEGWTNQEPVFDRTTQFCWIKIRTFFDDGTFVDSEITKDEGLALTQGKSTSYYQSTDPLTQYPTKVKDGDCWFDTGYHLIHDVDPSAPANSTFSNVRDYIGYYIKEGNNYTKITSSNLNKVTANTTKAYTGQTLKQCKTENGTRKWVDIGGELVTNKITANYVNALDITAKKINIYNGQTPIFIANSIDPPAGKSYQVKIGGFEVNDKDLFSNTVGENGSVLMSSGHSQNISTLVDGLKT